MSVEMRLIPNGLAVEVKFVKYHEAAVAKMYPLQRQQLAFFDRENKRWLLHLKAFLPLYRELSAEFMVSLPTSLRYLIELHTEHQEFVFKYPVMENLNSLLLPGWKMDSHQEQALTQAIYQWHYEKIGAVISIPVGFGKTMVGMGFQRYTGMKAIVFCPASIMVQWKREIEKFIGGTAIVIDGTPQKREKLWAEVSAHPDRYDFIITNFEKLRSDYDLMPKRELLIVDEAHRFKEPSAEKSKQLFKYRRYKARVMLALTGTFIINAKHDAWNLMRLIGVPFESSLDNFVAKYCHKDNYDKPIGWKPEIRTFLSRLSEVTYYRSKAELSKDLPPRNDRMHEVLLPPGHRKFYNKLKDGELDYLDSLGREATKTELEGVWVRLRQAAAAPSAVKLEDRNGNQIELKVPDESGKLDWLKDFLQDYDDDFMILYSHSTGVLDAIQAKFPAEKGFPWVRIDGSIPGPERQVLIDRAREAGKAYFLITDALKEGANLQFCNQLVFFTLPLTDADREQIEGRIWRKGQLKQCFIHYVLALDTEDYKIYRKLQAKADLMIDFKRQSNGYRGAMAAMAA